MTRSLRKFVSSNGIAVVALFVALSGTASAATYVVASNSQIGPGTVSGHHPPTGKHANIVSSSVNSTDLASNSVTTGKIANGTVTGTDIKNGSVGRADLAQPVPTTVAAVGSSYVCQTVYNTFCGTSTGDHWAALPAGGDTTWQPAQVLVDAQGFVHLQGMAHCVTTASCNNGYMFFLPPSLRPAKSLSFSVDSNSTSARIDIAWFGPVTFISGGDPTNYVSLSGITFHAG